MNVIRFLFALLLGFVLGVGAAAYLLTSEAGDLVIKRTESVQDLQRRLHDVETQRDQLSRQLEDVSGRAQRMEQAFQTLEQRFNSMLKGNEMPPPREPAPGPRTD
jgi:TolA-binding protein